MLSKRIVGRPVTIIIVFILLIGLGFFSLVNLPIDLMPEINPPYLVIFTGFPGAGPGEVERTLTRILEATLSGVSGLENLTSISSTGSSIVILQFTFGIDLVDASLSVRDALDRVRNVLPSNANTPMVIRMDPDMLPIMSFMVTGNRSPEELRELAEDTIVPRIEQTPGVATASVSGGRDRVIRVEIPQNRLEAYGLTITQIQQVMMAQNMQVAAGTIVENNLSYILTTMGEYTSLDEIRNTVITFRGGGISGGQLEPPRQIYLRDIADVFWGLRDERSIVYVDGQSAITMEVQKQSGENSVQAARELRTRIERMQGELPPDIRITELSNTTDIIENSINQVTSTAISGGILAILVLFIFLRSFKPTIIIGISIPVSIIITLMLMYFVGLTLNMMTLAGLVLGIGMLVDNSIVILDNIYRYREKGAKLKTASILGTQEMTLPIILSTLTTICVFAPLVMFQDLLEMAGEMFAGLAFTVVISMAISLLTALFLVPVLTSRFFPLVTRKQKPLRGRLAKIDGVFNAGFEKLENSYCWLVGKILRKKTITILLVMLLLVISIAMIPVLGWIFMPAQAGDNVNISITLPVGTPLHETEGVLRQLEQIAINEIQGYERLIISAGGGGLFGGGSNSGSLQIRLPPYEERIESAAEIREIMRAHYNNFPGVSFGGSGMNMMAMFMGGNAVEIKLRVDDLERGKAVADRIAALLMDRMGDELNEPSIDLTDGLPQIEILLDRTRMYALGLNAYTVGTEIRAAVDGVNATRYRSGGRDYDVLLILAEADRSTRPALDQIFINSQVAGRVPLSSFVSYREGTGPIAIQRENQSRVINISAGARPGVRTHTIQERVEALIASEIPLDDDIIIEYGGESSEMIRIFTQFLLICIVAAFLVFGVMASLFESFKDPFIIIFTIPLTIIGIVLIYFATNEPFNVMVLVGLLVLFGIIVNNGIILVDYTNLLRKRGYKLHEACVEAARTRLRPILMTTLTTVFGLLPMAFFPGEGSEMVGPIGKTVFGGLSFGTLMTLFLMPTIYYILNRKSDQRAARAEARRELIAAGLRRGQIAEVIKAEANSAGSAEATNNETSSNEGDNDVTS